MQDRLLINDRLSIPRSEFRFTFARSSGPGGQNVNKLNTKAVLRWRPEDSPSLPADVLARFLTQCRHRINDRGELVLTSDRYRVQGRNIADCLDRLKALVAAAAVAPRRRRPTRRPRAANEKRLRNKRSQANKKANRQRPNDES